MRRCPNPIMHPLDLIERKLHTEKSAGPICVAFDAWEDDDPAAARLTVGLPATISIRTDSYSGTVLACTRRTITFGWTPESDGCVERLVFRPTKNGWRLGSYRLSVGAAIDYRDPSF